MLAKYILTVPCFGLDGSPSKRYMFHASFKLCLSFIKLGGNCSEILEATKLRGWAWSGFSFGITVTLSRMLSSRLINRLLCYIFSADITFMKKEFSSWTSFCRRCYRMQLCGACRHLIHCQSHPGSRRSVPNDPLDRGCRRFPVLAERRLLLAVELRRRLPSSRNFFSTVQSNFLAIER